MTTTKTDSTAETSSELTDKRWYCVTTQNGDWVSFKYKDDCIERLLVLGDSGVYCKLTLSEPF